MAIVQHDDLGAVGQEFAPDLGVGIRLGQSIAGLAQGILAPAKKMGGEIKELELCQAQHSTQRIPDLRR